MNEKKLVRNFQNGDVSAYNKLFEKYNQSVYLYLLPKLNGEKEVAEDLTSITLTKVYKNIDKYSPTSSFSSWVFRIANNALKDYIRSVKAKKRDVNLVSIYQDRSIGDSDQRATFLDTYKNVKVETPESLFITKEETNKILVAINNLNDSVKDAIYLRLIECLTYEEIADKLNLNLNSVKAKLHRGKLKLKETLKR